MGPTRGRQDPGGPHVGPMNFVFWVVKLWWPSGQLGKRFNKCHFQHYSFIEFLHFRPFWLLIASVTTRRAPLCGGSASDSVAETQRTVPPTHVAGGVFWETQGHAESTQRLLNSVQWLLRALRLLRERSRHVRAAHGGAPPTCVVGTVCLAGKCKFNASRDIDSRASNVRARCHRRTRDAEEAAAAYLLCSERACHAPCRHVGGSASVISVGLI